MEIPNHQNIGVYDQCKNYLCPEETVIRESFPTLLHARLRAKALDPYGFMFMKNFGRPGDSVTFISKCQHENCHAVLHIRKVRPDKDGNSYGLYGCITHQHPLLRNKRSEIFFKNKVEAQEFFDNNFKRMYTIVRNKKEKDLKYYICRRSNLKRNYGHHPCDSKLILTPAFYKETNGHTRLDLQALPSDEVPFTISGTFYHSHENDEKYHKNEAGGWTKFSNITTKKSMEKDKKPRIKNGKVFPIAARMAGITVEDIEKNRKWVKNSPGFRKTKESRKAKSKIKHCTDKVFKL